MDDVKSKDSLGDRMKSFENVEAMRKLDSSLPIMVRLDGRAFHSFTRGMERPFDVKMTQLMQATTMHLVEQTNAVLGYTQSDEISLVLLTTGDSQPYFGARVQKICSTLASVCSVFFNTNLPSFFPDRVKMFPVFDCRAWNVPSLTEAANTILWRELDASKNSIQMAARSMFSHNSLQDLTGAQMVEKMLAEKGVSWDDYPSEFKRGSFFRRVTTESAFTTEEIALLPEKHLARRNPALIVKRSEIKKVEFPKLSTIANLPEVLFGNEQVVLRSSK